MPEAREKQTLVSRGTLWFGLLGGAAAWTVHIILAPIMAEWGCVSPAPSVVLGGTWTTYAVSLLSLAMLLVAAVACVVAYRGWDTLRVHQDENIDLRGTSTFMARAGVLTSGIFVFVILVQSIPILYFLSDC